MILFSWKPQENSSKNLLQLIESSVSIYGHKTNMKYNFIQQYSMKKDNENTLYFMFI